MARLDIEKLSSRIDKVIGTEEALREVVPIEWPKNVLDGKENVSITNFTAENGSVRFTATTCTD